MSTLVERLKQFLEHEHITLYQANRAAGLCTGLLHKAMTGKGLTSDTIERLLIVYPQLNADWLLTGRGNMLLAADARPAPLPSEPLPPDVEASLYRCVIWHILLQDTYADTLRELDQCLALVDSVAERTDSLKGQLSRLRQMLEANHEYQPQDHGLYEISLRIAAGDDGKYTPRQLKTDLDFPRRLARHLGFDDAFAARQNGK